MSAVSTALRETALLLTALLTAACVVLPRPGPLPPRVEVLTNAQRAALYGATANEILNHPELRGKVRQLFGSDWDPGAEGRRVAFPAAPAFFSKPFPTRLLRIEGADYIAAPGCAAEACLTDRGLLLVRADGALLLARLDVGGFTRYYAFGAETATPVYRELLDAAWRELEQLPPRPARAPAPRVAWQESARQCYEDLRRGKLVYYQPRPGGGFIGRAACDQYVGDMELLEMKLLETEQGRMETLQPLEVMQLEEGLPKAR